MALGSIVDGIVGGIAAVLPEPQQQSDDEILAECQKRLASYMVPNQVHFVETIPLNNSGKVDRRKIVESFS